MLIGTPYLSSSAYEGRITMSISDFAKIFWIVIAFLIVLLLGDYLGYKLGRRRLALIVGVIGLITVVAFAIYAGVNALY